MPACECAAVPGPYFPNSGRGSSTKSALRIVRPQFNMMLHLSMLDDSLVSVGVQLLCHLCAVEIARVKLCYSIPPSPQVCVVSFQPDDDTYEVALREYYTPYHRLVDRIIRVAANHQTIMATAMRLSVLVGLEGAIIGLPYFAKLWYEIYQSDLDRTCIEHLCENNYFIEYVTSILLHYRSSLSDTHIYQFMCTYLPKVCVNCFIVEVNGSDMKCM